MQQGACRLKTQMPRRKVWVWGLGRHAGCTHAVISATVCHCLISLFSLPQRQHPLQCAPAIHPCCPCNSVLPPPLQVYAALGKIEFAGDQFAESVRAILERETYWVAWKKEGCPPFERPPESSAAAGGAKADGDGAAAAGRPLKRRRGTTGQRDGRLCSKQRQGLWADIRGSSCDCRQAQGVGMRS